MQSRIAKFALLIAGFVLWSALLIYATTSGLRLQSDDCDYKTMREFPSPNGRSRALVIRIGCGGATNAFVTSVAIKIDGEPFNLEKDGDYLFLAHSEIDIEVIWDGNCALTIVYQKPYRIYRQLVVWRTMPISYREKM